MALTIKTNRQWRNFSFRNDVPKKVLASQFDHLDIDDALDGFFKYRGYWYHTSDFMKVDGLADDLPGWHGYVSDSYFSGVVVKLSKDNEQYQVGTYFS